MTLLYLNLAKGNANPWSVERSRENFESGMAARNELLINGNEFQATHTLPQKSSFSFSQLENMIVSHVMW